VASYGLDRMPSDMLDSKVRGSAGHRLCPIEDQAKIVAILRLAPSRETGDPLIHQQVAAAGDIDATVAAMYAPGGDFLTSARWSPRSSDASRGESFVRPRTVAREFDVALDGSRLKCASSL